MREIYFYKHYFFEFYERLSPKAQLKVDWTISLIASTQKIPEKYFKHITNSDALYEIRIEVGSDIYRIFCFFDSGNLIIVANGFQKKSQKTPKSEIELAEKLKKIYFDEKK